MPEFTVERRSFLFGAVLAPFASCFAAAGVEPRRSGTDFIISPAGGRDQFHVYLTEDGAVDDVLHSVGDRTFKMTEKTHGLNGWRMFQHIHGPHSASIRFRVDDPNAITIDYVMAKEILEPFTAIKDSTATPAVEIDWIGFR